MIEQNEDGSWTATAGGWWRFTGPYWACVRWLRELGRSALARGEEY